MTIVVYPILEGLAGIFLFFFIVGVIVQNWPSQISIISNTTEQTYDQLKKGVFVKNKELYEFHLGEISTKYQIVWGQSIATCQLRQAFAEKIGILLTIKDCHSMDSFWSVLGNYIGIVLINNNPVLMKPNILSTESINYIVVVKDHGRMDVLRMHQGI